MRLREATDTRISGFFPDLVKEPAFEARSETVAATQAKKLIDGINI